MVAPAGATRQAIDRRLPILMRLPCVKTQPGFGRISVRSALLSRMARNYEMGRIT